MVCFRRIISCFVCLLVYGWSQTSHAHFSEQSYIFLRVHQDFMEGRVEVTTSDLGRVVDIDTNNDSAITSAEVDAAISNIADYLDRHFSLSNAQIKYNIVWQQHKTVHIEVADYVVIEFTVLPKGPIPDEINIHYSALHDVKPDHRGGLVIEHNVKTGVEKNHSRFAFMFAPDRQTVDLSLVGESRLVRLGHFVREGVWHIWIGLDHVLFLVALLLPSVLVRKQGRWYAVEEFRMAFWKVFKVITLFTIAHSITLSLAALGYVNLPTRLVESVIAVSVLLVAINNMFPFFNERIWWVVFGFGLFHGFGFASVLNEIAIGRGSKALSLVGFNIGVEIGQLLIIALIFPLLYLLRRHRLYSRILLAGVSAVIAILACNWFLERTLDIALLQI